MCIAIAKYSSGIITEEQIRNAWRVNSDGGGFAWSDGDKVYLRKGFFEVEEYLTAYFETLDKYKNSPFLLHMRIATHGAVNKENCHPFWVEEDRLAFIHNGVIHKINADKSKESDTDKFNKLILQKLPSGWQDNEAIQQLISEYISTNKIATLDHRGRIWIWNKGLGEVRNNVWYSNSSFKRTVVTKVITKVKHDSKNKIEKSSVGRYQNLYVCDICGMEFISGWNTFRKISVCTTCSKSLEDNSFVIDPKVLSTVELQQLQ